MEAGQPVEALWGMITDAQVTIDHNRARLQKGAAVLQVEIRSPQDAVLDAVSTEPSRLQENPNAGTQKLVVRLNRKVTREQIEAVFR